MEETNVQNYNKSMSKRLLGTVIAVALFAGFAGGYLGVRLSQQPLSTSAVNTGGPILAVGSSTGNVFFVVNNDGNVGVNTLKPAMNLDVTGIFRAWWAFVPRCTGDIEGAFTYDRVTHHFVGCNGHDWRVLDK